MLLPFTVREEEQDKVKEEDVANEDNNSRWKGKGRIMRKKRNTLRRMGNEKENVCG